MQFKEGFAHQLCSGLYCVQGPGPLFVFCPCLDPLFSFLFFLPVFLFSLVLSIGTTIHYQTSTAQGSLFPSLRCSTSLAAYSGLLTFTCYCRLFTWTLCLYLSLSLSLSLTQSSLLFFQHFHSLTAPHHEGCYFFRLCDASGCHPGHFRGMFKSSQIKVALECFANINTPLSSTGAPRNATPAQAVPPTSVTSISRTASTGRAWLMDRSRNMVASTSLDFLAAIALVELVSPSVVYVVTYSCHVRHCNFYTNIFIAGKMHYRYCLQG